MLAFLVVYAGLKVASIAEKLCTKHSCADLDGEEGGPTTSSLKINVFEFHSKITKNIPTTPLSYDGKENYSTKIIFWIHTGHTPPKSYLQFMLCKFSWSALKYNWWSSGGFFFGGGVRTLLPYLKNKILNLSSYTYVKYSERYRPRMQNKTYIYFTSILFLIFFKTCMYYTLGLQMSIFFGIQIYDIHSP